ncbi:Vps36-domain-containing protein [Trichodelitschia bisporula]|uniref:Vacuolar protein-sorting-associated protein 36 n=1 Tax=Trichodelitschia bisporula TaxID=703511 RepID=A0A6G1HI63_9PEZI|nr:Vps36-domain-containing protein [Trichodelitschia bisporula]
MLLRRLDLTTALRPSLLPDETLLFVQNAVGLYEGKFKIPQYQNGHAYLTSHRACYVDNAEPRKHSVAIDLKEVNRPEFYAGFLKSSPKVTLYAKPARFGARSDSFHPPSSNATWVCPICSFSNPVPSNFDPATASSHTQIPPCLACGIKPPVHHVVKAALRQAPAAESQSTDRVKCPRCTFANHPTMLSCEMCEASLVTAVDRRLIEAGRAESPGPELKELSLNEVESVKFSFRDGGGGVFYERLKSALVQRKWLLQSAPPVPKPTPPPGVPDDSNRMVGIARLERHGQEVRQNNQLIIGNAFEDLEALMTSAKEVIALAESFSSRARGGETDALLQSASALGLTTTKDVLNSDSLYISELSRTLAEFLTDDAKGVLRREGGIMPLVDLWAVFNSARNGIELVSPSDFQRAVEMWDKLKLPVRLRRFRSGLAVVQGRDRTDDKTIASLLSWLQTLHREAPPEEASWDWRLYGRGVTAQEVARKFGWSVGVASEELEMAEERGVLCREHGLDGLRFWENWLVESKQGLGLT